MKRNLIVLAFMALFALPCHAQLNKEALKIYKDDGTRFPTYLTFKLFDNAYEIYCASSNIGIIGTYKVKCDTITLTPKFYNYGSRVVPIETEISAMSVPLIFLKKGAKLIDITPYESYPVFDGWLTGDYRYKFHQIK